MEHVRERRSRKRRSRKRRLNIWQFAAAACAVIFLFSAAMAVRELAGGARERAANQVLVERVREVREAAESEGEETPSQYAPSGRLLAYDSLWQENHDLAGWLTIEDLGVDLPVMYRPSRQEYYYLRRGFDGGYAHSGSLFLGDGWEPDNAHGIIYGHNMKDGSMFGKLDQYQSEEYARNHPLVRFDTLTQEREYTVLAAFYGSIPDASDEDAFRYYEYARLDDKETFDEYLTGVREAALYDTGVKAEYGDRLLTLSTCSYHEKDGRFVVVLRQTK